MRRQYRTSKESTKLSHCNAKISNLKLILIGHIRDQEYLNEAIKSGLQQVKYVGSLNHDSKNCDRHTKPAMFFAYQVL